MINKTVQNEIIEAIQEVLINNIVSKIKNQNIFLYCEMKQPKLVSKSK